MASCYNRKREVFLLELRKIEYPGAFYHVIQRGNNQENIFRSDADKVRYLNYLVKVLPI